MTAHQQHLVDEAIQRCADIPIPTDPMVAMAWDYLLCLWVEREINVAHRQGIPYQEIHQRVNEWLGKAA